MNILFIDTETTGLNSKNHTVIEIACRLDVDGQTVDRFHAQFFSPKFTIDLGALKVNKMNIKSLVASKPEETQVAEFVDWLLQIQDKVKGEIVASGQNVPFDINFLISLLERYNVEGLTSLIGYKVLDTFGLAFALVETGKLKVDGKLNLGNIAKALGVDLTNRTLHTAKDDVEVAAECLYALLELMRK